MIPVSLAHEQQDAYMALTLTHEQKIQWVTGALKSLHESLERELETYKADSYAILWRKGKIKEYEGYLRELHVDGYIADHRTEFADLPKLPDNLVGEPGRPNPIDSYVTGVNNIMDDPALDGDYGLPF